MKLQFQVVAVVLLLSVASAASADTFEDALRAKIKDKLDSKTFGSHRDNTSSGTFGKKGRETWIDAKSGLSEISISKTGDGLDTKYVAKITVPISGRYDRKTFKGIGSEYTSEGWNTSFKFHITYTVGFGVNELSDESISDSSTAADHDAVQWAKDDFGDQVVKNLK